MAVLLRKPSGPFPFNQKFAIKWPNGSQLVDKMHNDDTSYSKHKVCESNGNGDLNVN